MADITREHRALLARILEGDGLAGHAERRAAFNDVGPDSSLRTLLAKVARHAYKITDEDIAAVKSASLSEDQIFELVVCAAVGQATRQYQTARSALEAATEGREHAPRHPR